MNVRKIRPKTGGIKLRTILKSKDLDTEEDEVLHKETTFIPTAPISPRIFETNDESSKISPRHIDNYFIT